MMKHHALSPAACALVLALAAAAAAQAPPTPAPEGSPLPEIGRVRSTAPACAAMRDLIVPSFAAARRADARFEQTRVHLPQYVEMIADPEHKSDVFRSSMLSRLDAEASAILNETLAINKALGDPRLKDTSDPTIAAEKAQLQQLYNTQQARANLLEQYVMRERNQVVRHGMEDSGGFKGKHAPAQPGGTMTLPPEPQQPTDHTAPEPSLTAAPGMPVLSGVMPMADKAAIKQWTSDMANAVRFSENQAAKTFLTIANVCR
jgi:hypothetical protein